ncbi:MAG TPA: thioesterase family protein [Agitococcus sp.]|nr:thioesterase family protein [Agitococcus sp.]HMY01236.1 thioesterase family protein [Agitococcus sp.]HMY29137.1 thioesterase family protein [Agitococcus sp.]HNB18856.1 thioesterase family protein [Agitococcus sp.]HNH44269.1 thioesterase family protein [Agitococcus sp.]
MPHPQPSTRTDYAFITPITTRWSDNDIYGHVNNVTYYSYFDTVANTYLIEYGHLNIHNDQVVGYVVNSGCNYYAPVAFPDKLEGGLRVNRLGVSSVEYGVAIFKEGEDVAVADGHFVHVFVDKQSNKSVPIPDMIRKALERIKA